jgi:hypothetical protein
VGTYTISATLNPAAVLTNYTITYNTAAFTITPLAASVTPNPASKLGGTADPAFTGTLTGFLPADGVTATYSRTPGESAGTYTISATLSPAGVLTNYTITYNTAVFTITAPVAGVSPTTLPFGNQTGNTTSPPRTVTLSNTGTAVLTIFSIGLTGTNPGDFAISGTTCGASLAAGANCSINVTFTPTVNGGRSASLAIIDNSNGVPGSTQTVALTGTGTGLPNAPSALTTTRITRTAVRIAWTNGAVPPTRLGTTIQRSTDGINWTTVATVGVNTTSRNMTGLVRNTPYWFRVQAFNTVGVSTYSNVINATTLAKVAKK